MVVPVLPAGCFDAFRMYAAHEGNKPVLKLLSAITEIKEAQEEEESGEPDEDPVEGFEISKAVAEIPVKKEEVYVGDAFKESLPNALKRFGYMKESEALSLDPATVKKAIHECEQHRRFAEFCELSSPTRGPTWLFGDVDLSDPLEDLREFLQWLSQEQQTWEGSSASGRGGKMMMEEDGEKKKEDGGKIMEEDGGTMMDEDGEKKNEEDGGQTMEEDGEKKHEEDGGQTMEEDGEKKKEEDGGMMLEEDGEKKKEEARGKMMKEDGEKKKEEDGERMMEEDGEKKKAEDVLRRVQENRAKALAKKRQMERGLTEAKKAKH
eukprot:g6883.t1